MDGRSSFGIYWSIAYIIWWGKGEYWWDGEKIQIYEINLGYKNSAVV